jgi:hypothetical protein
VTTACVGTGGCHVAHSFHISWVVTVSLLTNADATVW